MGLFSTTAFKVYADYETTDDATNQKEMFFNPLKTQEDEDLNNIVIKRELNYQKLDEFGFIEEGSYLERDVIAEKRKMLIQRAKDYKDISTEVKKDYTILVDKVISTRDNKTKLSKLEL